MLFGMTLKYSYEEHMKIAGKNPITELDYPDPDVIRVDDTYYMVSTTMHFMPGCEILRSYDLIHWEHLSYVYERLTAQRNRGLLVKNCYGKGMGPHRSDTIKGCIIFALWRMIPEKHTFILLMISKDHGKTHHRRLLS